MAILHRESRPHPELRRWLAPVTKLYAGVEAGAYDLPDDLNHDRAALLRVQAAIEQLPPLPDLQAVEEEVSTKTAMSKTIKPALVGKPLLEAEALHEQLAASLHVLHQAETRAAVALSGLVPEVAEEAVLEHLRPALDATLADAAALIPALGGVRSTDELFRAADIETKREAWLALEALADRWRLIRAAYFEFYRAGLSGDLGVNDLDARTLLNYHNFDELPRRGPTREIASPAEPALFMVWLVTGEPGGVVPVPWLPLAGEVTEAIQAARERNKAVQAEGHAQMQSRRAGRSQGT